MKRLLKRKASYNLLLGQFSIFFSFKALQGCCCQAGEIVQISFDWRDVLFTENMLTNLWKIEANEQPVIHGIEIIQQNSQEKNLSKWYRVKWSQDKNQDKIRSLIYWLNSMLVRWWDGIFFAFVHLFFC